MLYRLLALALMFGSVCYAGEVSSSSGFLDLPDTLSEELQTVAQEGFMHGFGLASVVMIATGALSIAIHLINRGAGR